MVNRRGQALHGPRVCGALGADYALRSGSNPLGLIDRLFAQQEGLQPRLRPRDQPVSKAPMQSSNLVPIQDSDQAQLFSADEFKAGEELVASLEADKVPDTKRRTGRTLERRRGLVKAILERVAAGMSQRDVAKLFGVSRQSIRMLVERAEDRGELEPIRKRIAHKYYTVAELTTEEMRRRLEEEPEKIKYHELSVGGGIAVNNANLLTGSATSITTKVVVDQDALAKRLEELKKGAIDV